MWSVWGRILVYVLDHNRIDMGKEKKFIEYEFLWEIRKLKIILSEYSSNGNMYMWLEDTESPYWEMFTDISCNYWDELKDKEIAISYDMINLCPWLLQLLEKEWVLKKWDGAYYVVDMEKINNEYEYDYYA